MEELFLIQQGIAEHINKLLINIKKDGTSRKTIEYFNKRSADLEAKWQEYQSNHVQLCAFGDKSYNYFINGDYERTRNVVIAVRELLRQGQAQLQPAAEQAAAAEAQPATSHTPQIEREGAYTLSHSQQSVGSKSKSDELLRKQSSNFRAFERTVMSIDLTSISDAWELEDMLRTLINRWSVIDSLHWEIDSELQGSNIAYETLFSNHERTFINIKKAINTKLQSVTHRERSTPQMDIPVFSGNYHQWVSFKDLFMETIHKNSSLSNAQKMQFLKSKVKGEAERLIQHLNISSENYLTAWDLLNNRFNNTKLIFTSHINILMNIPIIQQATAHLIKRLHDTTLECLNAIKNLSIDISTWDPLLVHILSQKLDSDTHNDYIESLKQPRELPVLKEFLEFLESKFTAMESANRKRDVISFNNQNYQGASTSRQAVQRPKQSFTSSRITPPTIPIKNTFKCVICNSNEHGLYYCPQFLSMSPYIKKKTITKYNLCQNCLYNHYDKACISEKRCRECRGFHNTILHEAYVSANKPNNNNCNSDVNGARQHHLQQNKNNTYVSQKPEFSEILLSTALIKVERVDGSYQEMRCLVDPGSQVSLLSSHGAALLGLPKQSCKGVISGVGIKESNCQGVMNINCKSIDNEFEFNTEVYVMKHLIKNLPNYSFPKPAWTFLNNIRLADPEFYISRPVDILLGADVYANIITEGICRSDSSVPIAQQTRLGWILSGNVRTLQCNVVINHLEDIKKFWEYEDISDKPSSSSEHDCIKFFKSTTVRLDDGKYQVRLPLKSNFEQELGKSKSIAVAQFKQLERKFVKNQDIAIQYKEFINEYIQLGHMKPCVSNMKPDCYLPHHCVQRAESTTTSLRVVFNASSKTSTGHSLNDLILDTPDLQQNLMDLIMKWRQYKIAFCSDIKQFFRQIWLHPDDQILQKIVWRDNSYHTLTDYQLLTVTYGTKAAPFLCMMTLRQLASDERNNYNSSELLTDVIENSFYMDDLLHGSHSIKSALKLTYDLKNLLISAGFELRKWKSNCKELLESVSKGDSNHDSYDFKQAESTKTLGLKWNPQQDIFTFQSKIELSDKIPTKRSLLSDISKIFDPLGWLTPITTKLKILFQSVWHLELKWDDELSENIRKEWSKIRIDLQNIDKFKIQRWLGTNEYDSIELHGYCDATLKSYGCVIYCRVIRDKNTSVVLLIGKSRLVPRNKTITIPRLELSGADLLSRLMDRAKRCFENYNIKVYGWTDSMAVLGWLQGDPSRWTSFVSNRVKNITAIIPPDRWRYVKSADNPADAASRGMSAYQLKDHLLWWNGPSTLINFQHDTSTKLYETNLEIKNIKQVHVTQQEGDNDFMKDLLIRFSSFTKLVRVTAWILRFRLKKESRPNYLTLKEIQRARNIVIKYTQQEAFSEEIKQLQSGKSIHKNSKIASLNPFISQQDGLLRLKGRLSNSSLSYDMKHPIIIPHESCLTQLLIDHSHHLTLHGGPSLTHSLIRNKFWIIGGNRAIKKRLRQCIDCRRHNPSKHYQLMGDLPEARCNISRPFTHTGVDYTGHVTLKASKGRGVRTTKGYVAVFICMATKAVHLELVSDITTSTFIAALRRMSARRGVPQHIYSDNGRNFIGADNLLKQEYEELQQVFNQDFIKEISNMEIHWHFNAPAWPSAGGLWESAVKSFKHHFKRILSDRILTYEELNTVVAQIEACMNSRPLCSISDDPSNELDFLTPAHFLTNGPTLTVMETERDLRTRWHLTQQIFTDVWKRWQTDYLTSLISRSKWTKKQDNIKLNDVVIIHDANLPPGRWALGKVIDLHPGKDGLVRVVTLKTKNGEMKRPIVKLSILPVHVTDQPINQSVSNPPPEQTSSDTVNVCANTIKISRPSTKQHGFLAMAIAFIMLISLISGSSAAYNITKFKDTQGLYFDKIANMKLIREEWKIISYYNMDPYWLGIKALNEYTTYLQTRCDSLKGNYHCKAIILQLQHEFSELEYYNQVLLSQHASTRRARARRGLINGVGYLANTLFGVLDEHFAEQYKRDITLIQDNQQHLAALAQNQTSILETEYNLLKRTEVSIEKQYKIMNQHIISLEKSTATFNKELQDLVSSSDFALSAIIASNMVQSLKFMQNVLLDTITDIFHGKFNIHLISPEQLREELSRILSQLSSDLTLPIDNINTNLRDLYGLLKIKARMLEKYLIFEIRLPLISRDEYEIFKIIPIPQQKEDIMMSIIPISELVSINIKKDSYLSMTNDDLITCLQQDKNQYLCNFYKPIYHLTQESKLCMEDQLSHKCKSARQQCTNQWIKLNQENTYFYFCCYYCKVRALCEEVTTQQLSQSGIMTVGQGCTVKINDFNIYAHKHDQSIIGSNASIIIPKLAPINHIINVSLPTAIESNETGFKQNRDELEALHKKIKDLQQDEGLRTSVSYHDVHHYILIYIIFVLGGSCILAFLYRRIRNYRIKKQAAAEVALPTPRLRLNTGGSVCDMCNKCSIELSKVRECSAGNMSNVTSARKVDVGTSPLCRKPNFLISEQYV